MSGIFRAALVVAVFASLVPSPHASADVFRSAGPFEYVIHSGTAIPNSQSVPVLCPTGTRAVAGGATVGTRANHGGVRLASLNTMDTDAADPDDEVQFGSFNSNTVEEPDTVVAICARGSFATSLVYRIETQIVPNGGSIGAGATCASYKDRIIGGGVTLPSPFENEPLYGSSPFMKPGALPAWGYSAANYTGSDKTFVGNVVCIGPGVRRVSWVHARTKVPAGKRGAVRVMCPGTTHVASGGFLGGGVPIASMPVDGPDADHTPDDGWRAAMVNLAATPALSVYAVCVK